MSVNNQYNTKQSKADHHLKAPISSEQIFKDLYDELIQTYQTIIKHMEQVDLLIDKANKDSDSSSD